MVFNDEALVLMSRVDWKCKQTWYELPNGLMEGDFKEWRITGELREHCYFTKGHREGLYRSWYKNGQLKRLCVYINGKKEGLCTTWDKEGQIKSQIKYDAGKMRTSIVEW